MSHNPLLNLATVYRMRRGKGEEGMRGMRGEGDERGDGGVRVGEGGGGGEKGSDKCRVWLIGFGDVMAQSNF